MTESPPSPSGLPLVGNTVAYARDPFGFAERAVADHGDVVDLDVLGTDGPYVLAHPEYVERALVADRESFAKTADFAEAFGSGLVAVEGEEWSRQRAFLQPLFYGDAIRGYADTMVDQIERRVDRWEPGETRPVQAEMQALTLDVLFATLFGRELSAGSESEDATLRAAASGLNARFVPTSWVLPEWVPTPSRRRFRESKETLRAEVRRLLRERGDAAGESADGDAAGGSADGDAAGGSADGDAADEAGPGRGEDAGDDLLSLLATARPGDGYPASREAIEDQLVTMVFAGHETTALALTYTWYLLARNPDVVARVHDEVDAVVGDGRPTADHLDDLPITGRVIREAMRLYPPVHTVPRRTQHEIEIGGYRLPAGAEVHLPAFLIQRDARFFDDPLAFDPERWVDGGEDRPEFAYFPFGGGPRRCIGQQFALTEATLAVASIARDYRLEWAGDGDLELAPRMTTQPGGDVPMRVRCREQ
ncbi:cytochrome P450 [Salinigranum sp. GCM10025319]|uniref:cytochrome P450 n=1 Tax=Salinigranum sp. GCM10025319 TaxID=3252687 RepID=UPI00361920DF